MSTDNFGNMESSVIVGMVRPISVKGNLESICGKYRGIQGHHNSCYLDATLFSMFTFTSVFDNLLFRYESNLIPFSFFQIKMMSYIIYCFLDHQMKKIVHSTKKYKGYYAKKL